MYYKICCWFYLRKFAYFASFAFSYPPPLRGGAGGGVKTLTKLRTPLLLVLVIEWIKNFQSRNIFKIIGIACYECQIVSNCCCCNNCIG